MSLLKILGVIPARYASTRFPGKPLVEVDGMSMVQRVYRQALQAKNLQQVVVATDDKRIFEHVLSFQGKAVMTSEAHPSGTDRVQEVATQLPDYDVLVNIQGDEPFLSPTQIDRLCEPFLKNPAIEIATLIKAIDNAEELLRPSVVKVVRDIQGRALYFSRSPVPFLRSIAFPSDVS